MLNWHHCPWKKPTFTLSSEMKALPGWWPPSIARCRTTIFWALCIRATTLRRRAASSRFPIYRFGGPQKYIEKRGHPRLRARHLPFRIHQAARDRRMQLMSKALAGAALPVEVETSFARSSSKRPHL